MVWKVDAKECCPRCRSKLIQLWQLEENKYIWKCNECEYTPVPENRASESVNAALLVWSEFAEGENRYVRV